MEPEEQQPNVAARVAAAAAVALVAVVVAIVLLTGGGEDYQVKARFLSASQLVKGNRVQVSGNPVGEVVDIGLTPDGQALVTMTIADGYAPLHRGTRAIVRQASLSGVANRYVDLHLAPAGTPEIPNGGTIPAYETRASVDLDQLFNTFGPQERAATRQVIAGFAETYAGRADQANRAFHYLNPALASSARLFAEVNRSTPELERFIVQSSRLFSHVAERRTDVAGLVDHLATVNSALAAQQADLREGIHQLPPFMRRANTTFVNLRATLDDLEPLVTESKPVVRKLRPLLADLRPLAAEAVPTVRDLAGTIKRSGDGNDLIDLMKVQAPLERVANGPVDDHGDDRRGAFPETVDALDDATRELSFARPYAPELTGWFDDFSASGGYDALGSYSRAGLGLSALTFSPTLGTVVPVPPDLRDEVFNANVEVGRNNRCPGSNERDFDGSNPWRPWLHNERLNCDPDIQPIGP